MVSAVLKSVLQLSRVPLTLTVGAAALLVAFFPGMADILEYDRARIATGEFWRLLSCHATHWNAEHLQWDLLMFLVLGGLCELRSANAMRFCTISALAAVSATVFLMFPDVGHYRGLSGIDTALFALLAIQLISQALRERSWAQAWAVGALLVGFMAKTAYEGIAGQTIFVDESVAGFVPLVWDHVAGAAVGALVAVCDLSAAWPSRIGTAGQASRGTRRAEPSPCPSLRGRGIATR
jgi:rhomboid family GlyGly-CTERM serine protease